MPSRPTLVISACLVGARCRYDGDTKEVPALKPLLPLAHWIPVCPELLAGFGVPRASIEWTTTPDGFRVLREDGKDVTNRLRRACVHIEETLRHRPIDAALLKEKSPSCGVHRIYLDKEVVEGQGMLTRRIEPRVARLFSEDDLELLRGFLVHGSP